MSSYILLCLCCAADDWSEVGGEPDGDLVHAPARQRAPVHRPQLGERRGHRAQG